jgi:hypothetical protein
LQVDPGVIFWAAKAVIGTRVRMRASKSPLVIDPLNRTPKG